MNNNNWIGLTFNKTDHAIERIKKPVYIATVVAIHVLYLLIFMGLVYVKSEHIKLLNTLLQIFICLILIFRFNPFTKHELREFDGQIIFGAALLLLFNSGIIDYIITYVKKT
jgi:hypothetical protein